MTDGTNGKTILVCRKAAFLARVNLFNKKKKIKKIILLCVIKLFVTYFHTRQDKNVWAAKKVQENTDFLIRFH